MWSIFNRASKPPRRRSAPAPSAPRYCSNRDCDRHPASQPQLHRYHYWSEADPYSRSPSASGCSWRGDPSRSAGRCAERASCGNGGNGNCGSGWQLSRAESTANRAELDRSSCCSCWRRRSSAACSGAGGSWCCWRGWRPAKSARRGGRLGPDFPQHLSCLITTLDRKGQNRCGWRSTVVLRGTTCGWPSESGWSGSGRRLGPGVDPAPWWKLPVALKQKKVRLFDVNGDLYNK